MIFVFFVWLKKTLRSFGDLLTWVFALCFLLGYLRFDFCLGICALLLAWVFALRSVSHGVLCTLWGNVVGMLMLRFVDEKCPSIHCGMGGHLGRLEVVFCAEA